MCLMRRLFSLHPLLVRFETRDKCEMNTKFKYHSHLPYYYKRAYEYLIQYHSEDSHVLYMVILIPHTNHVDYEVQNS